MRDNIQVTDRFPSPRGAMGSLMGLQEFEKYYILSVSVPSRGNGFLNKKEEAIMSLMI